MPDLTPNHPAVEALGSEGFDHAGGTMHAWRCEHPDRYPGYCTCPEEAVAIVRDNLTADDLRNTPAGRELMAEAWDERHATRPNYSQGHDDDCMGWEDCHCGRYLNPYRKGDA